ARFGSAPERAAGTPSPHPPRLFPEGSPRAAKAPAARPSATAEALREEDGPSLQYVPGVARFAHPALCLTWRSANVKEIWQERLRQAVRRRPRGRTFAAFNLNVDVVARVTPDAVDRLVQGIPAAEWERVAAIDVEALRAVADRAQFLAVLRHG